MESCSSIQDLMAITRALIQPSDRIAWLSILRAPWCGLTVSDLTIIAETDIEQPILKLIQKDSVVKQLSNRGQIKVKFLLKAIRPLIDIRGKITLRQGVEAVWLSLSGPSFIGNSYLNDCELFLELLTTLESQHHLITPLILSHAVKHLWSSSVVDSRIHVLTIHKAKGLEFDTVIIPGLEKIPRNQESELFRLSQCSKKILIALSPLPGEDHKPYQFLGHMEQILQHNEMCRLLYVACTRSRKNIHLFASIKKKQKKILSPPSSSLLGVLWPVCHTECINQLNKSRDQNFSNTKLDSKESETINKSYSSLKSCTSSFQFPSISNDIMRQSEENQKKSKFAKEDWEESSKKTLRVIVLHQIIWQINQIGLDRWKTLDVHLVCNQVRAALIECGFSHLHVQKEIQRIRAAVDNFIVDSRVEWIFSDNHSNIHNNWSLTGMIGSKLKNVVIDRSFVDSKGDRWIIDFQSSQPKKLDSYARIGENKNSDQSYMEHYSKIAKIVGYIGKWPIRFGIYFPFQKGWIEWTVSPHIN